MISLPGAHISTLDPQLLKFDLYSAEFDPIDPTQITLSADPGDEPCE